MDVIVIAKQGGAVWRLTDLLGRSMGNIREDASPEYLAARGRPESPDDLSSHDCITVDETGVPRSWKFVSGGNEIAAPIRTPLTVNTSEAAVEAAVEAAIAGAGIARVMSYKMEAARRIGRLSIVLDTFEKEPLPVHIVYTERKPMPLKLRVFLTWFTPRLKARLAPHVG